MDLVDALLMRVLDGEATDEDRARLLELPDAAERLARLQHLREELHASLDVEDIDISGEVMAAVGPGLAAVEDEAPTEDLGLDVKLSAYLDGELGAEERLAIGEHLAANPDHIDRMTDFADLGRQLREGLDQSLRHDEVELWGLVAREIGIEDPEEVPGWEDAAVVLREAIAARAELPPGDEGRLTAAIMNALPRPEPLPEPVTEEEAAPVPIWRQLVLNPALPALAALCVVVVLLGQLFLSGPSETDTPAPEAQVAEVEQAPQDSAAAEDVYAMVHETEVESLEMDDDVLVQVIQMEEGAPLFLMIDEGDGGEAL